MHTMGEERDTFVGLGWKNEIRSLGDLDVRFTPSSEQDIHAGNQCSDDYKFTPFLQSTQAWWWRMHEEHKQYVKNEMKRADIHEKDVKRCVNSESNDAVDLNVDNPIDTKQGIKLVGESLRSLSFRKRMRHLSPHRYSLDERIKNKMVSYVDLILPGPPPSRRDNKKQSKTCTRSAIEKYS
jgi:hypothetical protein